MVFSVVGFFRDESFTPCIKTYLVIDDDRCACMAYKSQLQSQLCQCLGIMHHPHHSYQIIRFQRLPSLPPLALEPPPQPACHVDVASSLAHRPEGLMTGKSMEKVSWYSSRRRSETSWMKMNEIPRRLGYKTHIKSDLGRTNHNYVCVYIYIYL